MATALKLKNDINKLKAALRSKATPKSFIPKLKSQLDKAEADYESVKAGKKSAPKASKQIKSTMDKLKAIIKKKKYGAYRAQGVDLKKDADRPALPTGKRISKNGNTYYEYRANRIDVKQPPKRYPKLEGGGKIEDSDYVAVAEKDGFWYIISMPSTKELAQAQIDLGVPKGHNGKVVTVGEAKAHKKVLGLEYLVKKEKGGYMADGGITPLDVSNQIYDITVRIAELGDINTEAAYEETKNLMKMRAALQARALHLQDMEMAKGGYMAHGGKLEVGDEGMYEGGEAVILTIDDKSYGYSYLDEDGKPKSQKMFAAKSKFENQFRVFPKYAGGGELHRSQEKYAYGRYMAMGGAIEHGLKKGDHIMVVRGNMLGIKNEITGEIVTLNIETGERKESKE